VPRGLELGDTAVGGSTSLDLDLPIEELDLSERPRNCLKRAQIDTIGQLVERTEDDLLAITNFGQKSLEEVVQKLDERGLSLRVKE
jgi:DNA-directed RNA polymerase subunit alpha